MSYRFLEDVAIADIAFEATGKTIRELFISAAQAFTNVMVKDLSTIKPEIGKEISVEAESIDMLLYNFLQELVFYKDTERLLFSQFSLGVVPQGKSWKLLAKEGGESIDPKRHELLADVKAVTLHLFEVKETKEGWRARVVLDI